MKTKLVEKGDISAEGIDLVDWRAIGDTAKSLTATEKLWVSKFTSGFSATASQMHYRYLGLKKKQEKAKEAAKEDGIKDNIEMENIDTLSMAYQSANRPSSFRVYIIMPTRRPGLFLP